MSVIAGLTENACAAALRVWMSAEDAISILELGTGIIMRRDFPARGKDSGSDLAR
jgi:hypothetical protein